MVDLTLNIDLITFLAISGVQLVLGTTFGWLLHNTRVVPAAEASEESQKVAQTLERLYELTGSLGHNVDEHATRVQAIGQELAEAQGKSDCEVQQALLTAMAQIAEANSRLQGELTSAEQKLQQQAGEIQSQMTAARTDALTGLSNRRAFDDALDGHLLQFQRTRSRLSLLLFDIDHFKKFNDTFGHLAGDTVLSGVARVLYRSMREVDTVARYGGEEFAVLVPDGEAAQAAELARKAVEASEFEFEGSSLRVTLSGGVADAQSGDSPAGLIKRADAALYASKKAGRNCCHQNDAHRCTIIGAAADTLPAIDEPLSCADAAEPAPVADPAPVHLVESVDFAEPQNEEPAEAEAELTTDELTGINNGDALLVDLNRQLARGRRMQTKAALVVADIDGLEKLNQLHGRSTGDVVLRAVTQFLMAGLRDMDMIARFDGDRFALVLPETDLHAGSQIAERVRDAIRLCKLRVGDKEIQFTISTGVAETMTGDDPDSLLRRAGLALKAAKQAGCDQTFAHDGQQISPVGASPVHRA